MTKRKKIILTIIMIICILIILIILNRSKHYYLASFEGKVIDTDTKEPIEGAVVLVVYEKSHSTIAGSISYNVDAQETLTDSNGEFKIFSKTVQSEKVSGRPRGDINIFKPGYGTLWHKRARAVGENKSWPPPEKYILYEIPKLSTINERRSNLPGALSFSKFPYEKQKLFINAINEERKNVGLKSTYPVPKEER
jgi:hypothetical protein